MKIIPVQSSKMVHAAMLEAVAADLVSTISLKRGTQNLQLSTTCRPIAPSLGHVWTDKRAADRDRISQDRSGSDAIATSARAGDCEGSMTHAYG
jgi:hypothetical protein